ncbi:MAG: 50S ribosomal protein L22 [Thermoplasmata archaeon HGW-Thermoplasmata-1]|nr:MAG: 50S ribosomal protein L22 [Thermoplasmata archaeon HGW-Thermoplasmata-1]
MRQYSATSNPEKTARAFGYEMHCSPKHCRNIVKAIKGMKLSDAQEFLTEVSELRTPVPFVVRKRKIAHRKGKIGPGAFPEKAARHMLKVLKNAENNAEYKGLDPEEMVIVHASAYRGRTLEGFMPRAHGRATACNEQTSNVEIIISEKEEA